MSEEKIITPNNSGTLAIYRDSKGNIEFRADVKKDTIWASLDQIASLFGRDKSVISRHIKDIFKSKELDKNATVAKNATVQIEGGREVKRIIEFFDLDVTLSVGYRANSKKAVEFRKWATKTLREHIVRGYTINRKRVVNNYGTFMKAVESVKALLPKNSAADTESILDLVKAFADTWVSLEAYDKESFTRGKPTKKKVALAASDLSESIKRFRLELMKKSDVGELFASPREYGVLSGIVGNVMQAFGGKDLYPSAEEKAAHLLYFMVKNHPFTDGNKRSGAFSFVWFLRRAGILNTSKITTGALTALTLLIAESDPKDKEKMTGLVTMLLRA